MIVTRPSLPARGGDYSVEGRAADGSRIFSLPFTPAEIADVPEQSQQFAFAIPMSSARAGQLATLRLAVETDRFGGKTPIVGSWVVQGEAAGIGIREADGRITDDTSRFVPHKIER